MMAPQLSIPPTQPTRPSILTRRLNAVGASYQQKSLFFSVFFSYQQKSAPLEARNPQFRPKLLSISTWLRSPSVNTWLRSPSVSTWLRSPSGSTWLRSPSVNTWRRSPSFSTWQRSPRFSTGLKAPKHQHRS